MVDNFTASDVVSFSLAFLAWFLLSVTQGYGIGFFANAFGFRSSGIFRRLILSILLAAALIPSLYCIVGTVGSLCRFGLIPSMWALNVAALILSVVALGRQRTSLPRTARHFWREVAANRAFVIALAIWIPLSLIMLVDFQVNQLLYQSYNMHDHGFKVAFADQMLRRNTLPPINPFFHPGRDVSVTWHFYWSLMCAAIAPVLGSPFDSRSTCMAGIMWTGVVLIACLRIGCEYFKSARVPKRLVIAITMLLLVVSNLDVLFTLPLNVVGVEQFHFLIHPSITFWTSEHVPPLSDAMLWVPHHVWGLVDGVLASMLLLEATSKKGKERLLFMVLAGITLASNVGIDVLTAMVFVVTWIAWFAILLFQRRIADLLTAIGASFTGLVAAIPFLPILLSRSNGDFGHLYFGMRVFDLINWIAPSIRNLPYWPHQLVYLICLPLHYLIGFGFLFVGPIMYWRQRKRVALPLSERELFLLTMALVSLVLASILRSGDGITSHNDFGWRAIMPAQFAFFIWTAQWLAKMKRDTGRIKLSVGNQLLVLLGLCSFFYGYYLDRTATANLLNAQRVYCLRDIYTQLQSRTPLNAVVQHNPNVLFYAIDIYSTIYGHRQIVMEETDPHPIVKDVAEYHRVEADLTKLFDVDTTKEQAAEICRRYGINYLLVKDTDKIWKDKNGWVYGYPLIAENAYCKVFEIQRK